MPKTVGRVTIPHAREDSTKFHKIREKTRIRTFCGSKFKFEGVNKNVILAEMGVTIMKDIDKMEMKRMRP